MTLAGNQRGLLTFSDNSSSRSQLAAVSPFRPDQASSRRRYIEALPSAVLRHREIGNTNKPSLYLGLQVGENIKSAVRIHDLYYSRLMPVTVSQSAPNIKSFSRANHGVLMGDGEPCFRSHLLA